MTTRRKSALEIESLNSHIEGRVGRVEGAVENLTREVQEVSRATRDIIASLGKFKDDVLGHIGQATAPKWPLITSFVMMGLTVIGLGGGLISQNISGQGQAIVKLDSGISSIKENLVHQNYANGQHETWRSDTVAKLADINEVLIALKDWRLKHTEDGARTRGEVDTAIKQMQDIIDKTESRQFDIRIAVDKFNEVLSRLSTLECSLKQIEDRQYSLTKAVSQLDYFRPGGNNPAVRIEEPKTQLTK